MTKRSRVVFVHGVGLDSSMWSGVMDCLSEDFHCHAIDMPGHGQATDPDKPGLVGYSDGVLRSLLSLLDNGEQFSLVGFSMGALIAAKIANTFPNTISHLVLMNAVYDRDETQRNAIAQRLAVAESDGPRSLIDAAISRWFTSDFVDKNPDMVTSVRNRLESNDPASFLAAYRVFATADAELTPLMSQIMCPTLALTAEFDANSTPAMSQALASEMPNAQAHILEGLAHGAPIEAPERVANIIEIFLSTGDIE